MVLFSRESFLLKSSSKTAIWTLSAEFSSISNVASNFHSGLWLFYCLWLCFLFSICQFFVRISFSKFALLFNILCFDDREVNLSMLQFLFWVSLQKKLQKNSEQSQDFFRSLLEMFLQIQSFQQSFCSYPHPLVWHYLSFYFFLDVEFSCEFPFWIIVVLIVDFSGELKNKIDVDSFCQFFTSRFSSSFRRSVLVFSLNILTFNLALTRIQIQGLCTFQA